jgi:RNA polymerase sigma-70 factor (ECF subfamily)
VNRPRPPLRLVQSAVDFEELLLTNLDRLYSLARHWSRTAEDAEDLVQETALKALRSFARLREAARGNAWLYRILLNCAKDQHRRRRDMLPLDAASNEGSVSCPDVRMTIVDAFRKVPREFAVVVWLADVEGSTYAEIAAALGIPKGTVASRLVRGRARFRAALAERRAAP